MKKIIIILMLIILPSSVYSLCYQEFANTSVCGQTTNGTYNWSGIPNSIASRIPTNVYDGNWSTFGVSNNTINEVLIWNITYIKPSNVTSALIQSDFYNGTGVEIKNWTIPDQCLNPSLNIILTSVIYSGSISERNISCRNASTNYLINSTTGNNIVYRSIYEEAIWWIEEPQNSCTYNGVGNWIINNSHGCNITINTNLLGNSLIFIGNGYTNIYSNITNWSSLYFNKGIGNVYINKSARIFR